MKVRLVILVIRMGGSMTMISDNFNVYAHVLILLFVVNAGTNQVKAQNTESGDFQVVQLASDQVFLQATSDVNSEYTPNAGDTLFLYREDNFVGSLKVEAVNFPRLLTSFLNEPFAITRGEFFLIKWNWRLFADADTSNTGELSKTSDRKTESILTKKRTPIPYTRKKEPLEVSGRIYSGINFTRSSTYWSRVQDYHDIRWSSLPYSSLNLTVNHLPGAWNLNVQGRYSYRFQTNSNISHPGMFSIYNLNAEKTFTNIPVTLQVGRFYNRFESTYSYWDGIMLHYNKKNWGAGFTSGLEPSRSNEGVQTDVPKTGAFIHYRVRSPNVRWYMKANAVTVYPSSGNGWMYLGFDQRLDFSRLSLSSDFRSDFDEPSGTMKISRFRLRANYDLTDWLELNAGYYKRTPFLFYPEGSWFLDARYRYNGGISLRIDNWRVSNSIRINDRKDKTSYSYNSRISWFDSPIWAIDWSAYGTFWTSSLGRNWNAGIYGSRTLHGFNVSTGIGVYRTRILDSDQYSGNLSLSASKRIMTNLNLSARYRTSYGELMNRNTISVSIWKSF